MPIHIKNAGIVLWHSRKQIVTLQAPDIISESNRVYVCVQTSYLKEWQNMLCAHLVGSDLGCGFAGTSIDAEDNFSNIKQ